MTLELMTQSVPLNEDGHTQTCTNEEHGSVLQSLQQRITKFQGTTGAPWRTKAPFRSFSSSVFASFQKFITAV